MITPNIDNPRSLSNSNKRFLGIINLKSDCAVYFDLIIMIYLAVNIGGSIKIIQNISMWENELEEKTREKGFHLVQDMKLLLDQPLCLLWNSSWILRCHRCCIT